jgi:cholesterol oxidase
MNGRLSSPLSALKPHYDVAVVGSGYGAGVAAARLASAGRSVCVLERGREIAIGEFPARLSDMQRETQVSSRLGRIGNPAGLFDIRLGKDVHVAMGCGLGGTSLINANVCLEPDPRVLADPRWPQPVRSDGMLAEGLARARAMLRPAPYPGLRKLLKLEQLGASASALGGELSLPPLHIAFERGANAAGVEQHACTLCGDCCSGCNVGAKTTTALTYLPAAALYGAQIFTRVLVRSIAKGGDGKWRLNIVTRPEEGWETRLTLTADVVVLGAGTLGSTEILFRSSVEGLALSECLGERFTTNGDALANAYNNDRPVNSVGVGYPAKVHTEPVGPAVAGLVDLRRSEKLDHGLALVEASIPSGASAILPALFAASGPLIGRDTDFSLADQLDEAGRAVASLVTGAYQGAIRNTQTFLAVGHDAGSGRMRLEKDRLAIDWPGAVQDPVFQRIEEAFMRATAATGGTYMKNPLSLRLMGGNLLTVHPLGGCAIGADRSAGVVNHKGQVFDGGTRAGSNAVHDGLYVCDGAVVPRSLGVHPLLTITALAERAMILLARDRGWTMRTPLAAKTEGRAAPPIIDK